MIGERLGLPSVGIMTSAFVSAAELMARVLGSPGSEILVTDHPISSASDAELAARAERAAAQAARILTGT